MTSHDDRRNRDRPRVRHEGEGSGGEEHHAARRPHLLLLQPQVPGEVHRRSRQVPQAAARRGGAARASRHGLHLPDASGGAPDRPRQLPALWHGARARRGHARPRPERRAFGHDAPAVDRWRPGRPRHRAGHGRTFLRPSRRLHQLGRVVVRHAGRAVGRLAVLRAWCAVGPATRAQHVHPDRTRHRHGLALQRRRDDHRRRGLFRIGGDDHRAHPAGPGTGVAGARRDLGRSVPGRDGHTRTARTA